MWNVFIYIYTNQHNCLYTYFRHGNHTVDDLMTLMIDTYICRKMNKWIYLSAHNSLSFKSRHGILTVDDIHMPRDVSIYLYVYACTYIYIHGNHTADDLMTLRICCEINKCIYLSIFINVCHVFALLMIC